MPEGYVTHRLPIGFSERFAGEGPVNLRLTRQVVDTFGAPSAFVTNMRSSPWLNDRTELLLGRLADHGMTLPENVVRELVSDHLDTTGRLMRSDDRQRRSTSPTR